LARWTLDGHDNASLFALDDHGTDSAWGGGAQAHFGALGLRLEYEQFNVRNAEGAKLVSFDVAMAFSVSKTPQANGQVADTDRIFSKNLLELPAAGRVLLPESASSPRFPP